MAANDRAARATTPPRRVTVLAPPEGARSLSLDDVAALVPEGPTLTAIGALHSVFPGPALASVATATETPPTYPRPVRVTRAEFRFAGVVRAVRVFEYLPAGSSALLRVSSSRLDHLYTAHVRPGGLGAPHYSYELSRGVHRLFREVAKNVPHEGGAPVPDDASNAAVVAVGERFLSLPESVRDVLAEVDVVRHRATLAHGNRPLRGVVEDESRVLALDRLLDDVESGAPLEWVARRYRDA